jgi:LysM repeat protein
VDPVRRRELTRFGAPVAFLAAVTVAVLLVKAGLNHGSGTHTDTVRLQTTTAATTTQATTTKLVLTGTPTSTTTTTPGAQYYVIQSGDTLGAIAAKYNTTVNQLLTLNPSVDPNALHPGDRIRVG